MDFKKKAFTLTEVITMLVIIGVVLVAQLNIFEKKLNDYGSAYYNAYNALKKAVYNVLADMQCPDSCAAGNTMCATTYPHLPIFNENRGHKCPNTPRAFPRTQEFPAPGAARQALCERLVEYINTSTPNIRTRNDEFINCERPSVNPNADNIGDGTLQFIGTNGYRFYISDMKTLNVSQARERRGEEDIDYYIVYVDLNGEKAPNRLTCNESDLLPDIVPFILTTRGEIIPTGLPTYLKTYITARVKLPSTYEVRFNEIISQDEEYLETNKTPDMSFFEAVKSAWQIDLNQRADNTGENVNVPSSVIYDEIDEIERSNITACYRNNATKFNKATFRTAARAKRDLYEQAGCSQGTFTCNVAITTYTSKRY